jgi:hypothetical protein
MKLYSKNGALSRVGLLTQSLISAELNECLRLQRLNLGKYLHRY